MQQPTIVHMEFVCDVERHVSYARECRPYEFVLRAQCDSHVLGVHGSWRFGGLCLEKLCRRCRRLHSTELGNKLLVVFWIVLLRHLCTASGSNASRCRLVGSRCVSSVEQRMVVHDNKQFCRSRFACTAVALGRIAKDDGTCGLGLLECLERVYQFARDLVRHRPQHETGVVPRQRVWSQWRHDECRLSDECRKHGRCTNGCCRSHAHLCTGPGAKDSVGVDSDLWIYCLVLDCGVVGMEALQQGSQCGIVSYFEVVIQKPPNSFGSNLLLFIMKRSLSSFLLINSSSPSVSIFSTSLKTIMNVLFVM